jgi:hypothetical protein
MKKLVFFVAFLVFTRIGMSMGLSATPVGIGNFFIGAPAITESNLNQVLGLLVGPSGQPGVAGISGANGINGINGLPGIPGSAGPQGVAGIQGVKGDPGTPGVAGAPGKDGGIGSVGLGGGEVAIGTCDATVNVSAAQAFTGSGFELSTVTVTNIDAASCAGQEATIYLAKKTGESYSCKQVINSATLVFTMSTCLTSPLKMSDLGDNIGLEFKEIGAGA